jgi:peptidoglycan/LPS O-acetylase OafA/YrhL
MGGTTAGMSDAAAIGFGPEAIRPNLSLPSARLTFIDGLRGIAITMVMLFHGWEHANSPGDKWWDPLQYGYSGVSLFLVISGFCLYWPMVKADGKEPSLAEFARRRARRILPPYYAALTIATVALLVQQHLSGPLSSYNGPDSADILRAFAWHAALLHQLRPEYVWANDGPLWTLALETYLYVAMPILVLAARRWGIAPAVVFAAVLVFAYRLWLTAFIGGASAWGNINFAYGEVLMNALPGRWLEFALGMWAAKIVADGTHDRTRLPFAALGCAAILLSIAAASRFGVFNPISDPMFGIGFFFIILHAARRHSPNGSGILKRACEWKPLAWLGGISYSVYLLHQPLLGVFTQLSQRFIHNDWILLAACLLVFLPIVVGITYVFYLYVERPFLNTTSTATTIRLSAASAGSE